jgi:hypothetical protein
MIAIKKIVFSLLVIALFLPLLNKAFHVFHEKELDGYFVLKKRPDLRSVTWEGWFSGRFQEDFAGRIEDHIGLRNTFFRINCEMDYRLFGLTHAQGFIRGKGGNLFEEDYIREYTGRFFVGRRFIDERVRKLKWIQDTLRKQGVHLMFVLEPGKASIYPEYIPAHYHPENKTLSNYDYLRDAFQNNAVRFIDLNSCFRTMKDTSRYLLFPKYGMHWSLLGLVYAMDTLSKYIANQVSVPMPPVRIDRIRSSDTIRDYSENDIGILLNLIFPLPRTHTAVPDFTVDTSSVKSALDLLVIGDSYFNMVIQKGFAERLFRKTEFWYYYSKVWPGVEDDNSPVYVDKTQLEKKLQDFDVILIMVSEINLHCLTWGFIDEAYAALRHQPYPQITAIENRILVEREWFRAMVSAASDGCMTIDRKISTDADYVLATQYDQLANRTHDDSLHYLIYQIKANPEWIHSLWVRAKQYNIPLDRMIRGEAEAELTPKNKASPKE